MEVFFVSESDKTKVTQANNPTSDSQATNYTISQPTSVSIRIIIAIIIVTCILKAWPSRSFNIKAWALPIIECPRNSHQAMHLYIMMSFRT